jgi:hypothetical protein
MQPDRTALSVSVVNILSIQDGLQLILVWVGIDITGVKLAFMKLSSKVGAFPEL